MRELRGLLAFSNEVAGHPFFYEPTLVTMGLAVVAVIAAPWVLPIAGPVGLLVGMSAGFLLWVAIRLVPLRRFLPTSDRARVSWLRTAAAHPFGSTALGFLAGYAAVGGLTALARPSHFSAQIAGFAGGVIVGLPFGASYWASVFGYKAQRNRARLAPAETTAG